MIITLGDFINHNILWFVPIITIFLGIIFRIFECYEDNIDFYKIFDFGLDLIISAIILLVTNYKSEVSIWLILFFFIICMIVLIIRRRNFDAHTKHINFIGIITSLFVGLFMLSIALMHIQGFINICIKEIIP